MRHERLEKAIQILEPIAELCEVDNYAYFLVLKDHRDDDNYDNIGSESYCEKCIKKAVKDYRNKNREALKQQKKIVAYDCFESSMGEYEGFRTCGEECGKIIDSGLLLDEQEMEHWQSLDNNLGSKNPRTAFELLKILESGEDEFQEEIADLAEKVIAEHQADEIINNFEVRLLDLLSPDIYLKNYEKMKYGIERTLIVAEWLNRMMFSKTYVSETEFYGNDWRKQLFDFFHKALVQEYIMSLDGNADYSRASNIIKKQKKLNFIKPTLIQIENYPVTLWEHEIDEFQFDYLLNHFKGKRFKINPQGEHFKERDDWDWEVGTVSIVITCVGIMLKYNYNAPSQGNSGWHNWIRHNDGETVVAFLERCCNWFEENTVKI